MEVKRVGPGKLWRVPLCSKVRVIRTYFFLLLGVAAALAVSASSGRRKRELHQSCPLCWVSSDSHAADGEMASRPGVVKPAFVSARGGLAIPGREV